MTDKPYWYEYRTQRSHYEALGLPFAATYDDWEPVHRARLARGIRILPQTEWRLVVWQLSDDEQRFNAERGGFELHAYGDEVTAP